jgi:putative DNA primase/helicase
MPPAQPSSPSVQARAPSSSGNRGPLPLPTIRLIDGQLPRIAMQAEAALLIADLSIYQRGQLVMRPIKPKLKAADDRETFGWRLRRVDVPYLVHAFTKSAYFERFDARLKSWVNKDCPKQLAEVYLSLAGAWKLPVLVGIVNTPFLRRDGSLCERAGYDVASGLLFIPEQQVFPSIAHKPSRDDAMAALKYLDETLLEEFPFVETIDRSVALSGFLTALDRRAIDVAPLHGFSSPVAGTGKSLLVDLISILLTGHRAPVISQGKTEEEFEKRLGTALIAGDNIVSIDNCQNALTGVLLCQALTQTLLNVRLLGKSQQADVPNASTFFANGNNLVVADDLTRRTLLCQLDAGVEQPELRTFQRNVLETASTERGKLVAAILTVLRAWHGAGTAVGVDPLGSFEEWSFRVRSPLLWLDREDPCASIRTVRENDPGRALLNAVLVQWKEKLGTSNHYTVQDVIGRAIVDRDLFAALAAVAVSSSGAISNDRLGRWLGKNNNKIVNRLKLMKVGIRAGYPMWQVIET